MRKSKRMLVITTLAILATLSMAVGAAYAGDPKQMAMDRIRQVYDVVEQFHKDGPDLDRFTTAAIKGGLGSLNDPYTDYFSDAEFQDFMGQLNGSFTGIGAYLDLDGAYVIVSSPIKDSPAFKAGIQTGDRILEVNGTPVVGLSVEKAVRLIRGPEGTSVSLKLERVSESRTFTLTVTRSVITVPEVDSKLLDNHLGYIQITTFGDDAPQAFFKAVDELKAQGARGLVLDLRQNPGGYVQDAVDIASGFVPAGKPILWEVGKGGKTSRTSSGRLINLPTVVLVDNGSASASEILAGAIQDYGAAPLVGVTTFGKGTVQQLLNLSAGGALKVTIAEYLTAKERHVHHIGLTPDYVVERPLPDPEHVKPLTFKQTAAVGSVGLDVLYLQYRLKDIGYDPDLDGFFGIKTRASAEQFAIHNGLDTGMYVGPKFIEALNAKVAEQQKRVSKDDVQLQKAVSVLQGLVK